MQVKNEEVEEAMFGELEKLRRDNEMLSMNVEELTRTNEFLVTATWREREMKKRLHEALEELQATKKLVDIQNTNITDSINYASRIQDAIVPKLSDIKSKFKDAFIFFQAKDIVSGDFPWFFENEKYIYIAAVDCTGHGVPGAMMSLIGNLLLNDLAKKGDLDPATLLAKLHAAVVKTLKQDSAANQMADGMDIAMCRIDRETNEIKFSGAHRPLYHVSDGELIHYQGDKFPIGGNQYKGRNAFTNQTLQMKEGDCVYFFSDGLTDQFGGENELKFGAKRLKEFLLRNSSLSMQEQHDEIRGAVNEWKGDHKQLDDVLLLGIKF